MVRAAFVIFNILAFSKLIYSHSHEDENENDKSQARQQEKLAALARLEEILAPIKEKIDAESWKQIRDAWEKTIEVTGTEILKILFDTLEQVNGEVADMFLKLVLLTMVKNDLEPELWDEVKQLFGYEPEEIDQIVNVIEVIKEKIAKDLLQDFQLATVIITYKGLIAKEKLDEIIGNIIKEIQDFPEIFEVIPVSAQVVRDELRNLNPDELKLILKRLKEKLSKSNIHETYKNISMLNILSFIREDLNGNEIIVIFKEVKQTMVSQGNANFAEVLLDRISVSLWNHFLNNFDDLLENESQILEYIPVSILLEAVDEILGKHVADNFKHNLKDRFHEIPELTEKLTVASLLHSLRSGKPELWANLKLEGVYLTIKDQLGAISHIIESSKTQRFGDTEDLDYNLDGSTDSAAELHNSEITEKGKPSREPLQDPEVLEQDPETQMESISAQDLQDFDPKALDGPEELLEKVGDVLKSKLAIKTAILLKKIDFVSAVLTVKTVGAQTLFEAVIDYVTKWDIETHQKVVINID